MNYKTINENEKNIDFVQISDLKFNSADYSCLIVEDDPFNALFISAILEERRKAKMVERKSIENIIKIIG